MAGAPLDTDDLSGDLELTIRAVAAREGDGGTVEIVIDSSRGEIGCVLHPCGPSVGTKPLGSLRTKPFEAGPSAVVFVGGAMGGLDGPAGGLYPRLAQALREPQDEALQSGSPDEADQGKPAGGLASLRLHYRQPGEFEECVLDVLGGVSFLKGIGARRVALVGHSFGAAVVIKAGELSEQVAGVAALSPQLHGTGSVERLSPKPLLLAHGTADDILDCAASRDIYGRAREPKRLVLYEGAGHGLTQCADELFELLRAWLVDAAAGQAT